jgi:CRISPR-associated endonuclease/helicase Cas3
VSLSARFNALTGFPPMRWQERLFARLNGDPAEMPEVCDIPTGLGKTSIIPLWLLAIAEQAARGEVRLQRRLIYIVNRRTVVDQATSIVEQLRERILNPSDEILREIAGDLGKLSPDLPLAVSTLRGEFADNQEWKDDPSRPAVIVGTIDMIGSKLLFCGYGDGRYGRAHHAGLIGHDSLIVHDEAHLTPTFSDLLRSVKREQSAESGASRPIHVIELSATSRDAQSGAHESIEITDDDEHDELVVQRLDAAKSLRWRTLGPKEKLPQAIAEECVKFEDSLSKVLVYVTSPESAKDVRKALCDKKKHSVDPARVALLTGTLRGFERDNLTRENPVYMALLDADAAVERTVYLISTSAGEVGIDLDADHAVCDATTLDSTIQRLGRVNRRGHRRPEDPSRILVVCKPDEKSSPVAETLSLMQRWSIDGVLNVSPRYLRDCLKQESPDALEHARTPRPETPRLTDIVLDAWSMTSIDHHPSRPAVAPFLHGLNDDAPQTSVAWRSEVDLLHQAGVPDDELTEWFRSARILSHERVRERSANVKKWLTKLADTRSKKSLTEVSIVLIDERGRAEFRDLDEINDESQLQHKQLVLPVGAGGLGADGILDATSLEPVRDVADEPIGTTLRLRILEDDANGRRHVVALDEPAQPIAPTFRERTRTSLTDDESSSRALILLTDALESATNSPERSAAQQTLTDHLRAVEKRVAAICVRLGLPDDLRQSLALAAQWHDQGKSRDVWQRFACKPPESPPIAKSLRYLHPRALAGYRHEFGSVLDAANSLEVDGVRKDLVLHLIASHHGWARPHFEPRAYDVQSTTETNEEAAVEIMRRFGRLQQRHGRWWLAWVESILRCADIAASRQAGSESEGLSKG